MRPETDPGAVSELGRIRVAAASKSLARLGRLSRQRFELRKHSFPREGSTDSNADEARRSKVPAPPSRLGAQAQVRTSSQANALQPEDFLNATEARRLSSTCAACAIVLLPMRLRFLTHSGCWTRSARERLVAKADEEVRERDGTNSVSEKVHQKMH